MFKFTFDSKCGLKPVHEIISNEFEISMFRTKYTGIDSFSLCLILIESDYMLIRILTEQSSILPIQLAVDADALFRNLLTSHMRYSPIDLFQKTLRHRSV
jgi:hypothetical protein